ncbi:MAG: TraM recognition domain-containing protein [Acidobacteria bacterium]|nr:TraM recognition domain-containing protein [Acidobacteriota bacterium]
MSAGVMLEQVWPWIAAWPFRLVAAVVARKPEVLAVVPHLPAVALACWGLWLWARLTRRQLLHTWPRLSNFLGSGWLAPIATWFTALTLMLIRGTWLVRVLPGHEVGAVSHAGALMLYPAAAFCAWRILPPLARKGNLGSAVWAAVRNVRVRSGAPFLLPVRIPLRPCRRPRAWDMGPAVLAPDRGTVCRHTLVLGGSGAGKGASVLGHIIQSTHLPLIYQDVKAECPLLVDRWQRRGKPPIVWGASRPGGWPSLSWNPLQEAYDDPDFEDACGGLAGALLPVVKGENAWVTDTARLLLTHIFSQRVYRALSEIRDELKGHGIAAVLTRVGSAAGLDEQLAGKNAKEYASNALQTTLDHFGVGWARAATTLHNFSLSDVLTTDCYVLSNESDEKRRLPLQVFWRMLFRRMLKASELGNMLLLDEGLAAGYIPGLADALNTIRSKGGAIVFAIQNSGGLKAVYRDEAEAVSEAFASKIVLLSGLNPEDLQALTKQMGEFTVVRGRPLLPVKGEQIASLLPIEYASKLALLPKQWWGVIRIPGVVRTGRPILARMMASSFAVQEPHPHLAEAMQRAYPARPFAGTAVNIVPEATPAEPDSTPQAFGL